MSSLQKIILSILIVWASIIWVRSIFSEGDDDYALGVIRGTGGMDMSPWQFQSEYGNVWAIQFEVIPELPYLRAHIDGTTLTGTFWTQASGWFSFTNALLTPRDTASGAREIWDVTGYAWSDYAWYFTLSGVEYDPVATSLSGWLWSDQLGIVWLDSIVENLWLWFMWRVKIIGNVWWNSIYQTQIENYDQQWTFDMATLTSFINSIKRQVALNTRNVDASRYISSDFSSLPEPLNKVYYYQTGGANTAYVSLDSIYDSIINKSVRTIIVTGWDIYINTGLILDNTYSPVALIALKNSSGSGGNIYIHWWVRNIDASLMADGSIFSAKWGASDWWLYNPDKNTLRLPNNQLYIVWSVLSHNTIWWAGVLDTAKCPNIVEVCDYDTALRYDFNYFRNFQTGAIEAPDTIENHRWYSGSTYDDKSLIIEYDPRIVSDPPPGI